MIYYPYFDYLSKEIILMDNNNVEQPQYYEQPAPTWNNDAPSGEEGKTQAIWALVTGILGIICCGPCAIAAIILAVNAKNKGNTSGMATAGLVLGIIGCVLWLIGIIMNIVNPIDYSEILSQFG